jgi:hypothetical protein
MQCSYVCCISIYLKSVLRSKFLILGIYHPHTPYMTKAVRIRGYSSKPKRACEKKVLETLGYRVVYFYDVAFIYEEAPYSARLSSTPCFDVPALCFSRCLL